MSTQTGIICCEALSDEFAKLRAPSPPVRSLKVNIIDEKLTETGRTEVSSSFEDDYEASVVPFLSDKECCYILVRTDELNSEGNSNWVLVSYVPDDSKVRDKMVYAATRATLRREFGDSTVCDEIFGTTQSDINLEGFKKHVASDAAPVPLTRSEQEMKEIKSAEVGSSIGASTRHEISGGISFPIKNDAIEALKEMQSGAKAFVTLKLDVKTEEISLDVSLADLPQDLAGQLPTTNPRYVFIAYDHEFEGEQQRPIVFVYSCPGYAVPIKERMCYSSCRNNVSAVVEAEGVTVAKKLEIGETADLTEAFLKDHLHPAAIEEKKRFQKPKAAGRGPRRLVR